MDDRARRDWRLLAPMLPTAGLEEVRRCLLTGDRRLVLGRTTVPNAEPRNAMEPCLRGCPIVICGMAEGLTTVGECQGYFEVLADRLSRAIGTDDGCYWLLTWLDTTGREDVAAALVPLLDEELSRQTTTVVA